MKRLVKMAVAATVLAALGILISWLVISGGEASLAFARVADVLDNLRSATYDLTTESKGKFAELFPPSTGKGFFLAPSHERREESVDLSKSDDRIAKTMDEAIRRKFGADYLIAPIAPRTKTTQVRISDGQLRKGIELMPDDKTAIVLDMKKTYERLKIPAGDVLPNDFDMVRLMVREGNKAFGDKVERLGMKEIDGRNAVGFHLHCLTNFPMDVVVWADPQTARPIRIETAYGGLEGGIRTVMSNFRYDVDLDPSLFSVEVPPGYSTQTVNVDLPTEADLLRQLRTIAEHNKNMFPAKLGLNDEVLNAVNESAGVGTVTEITPDKATQAKLNAEMKKIYAKYGGWDKLRAKYGDQLLPEINAEIDKAAAAIVSKPLQKDGQIDLEGSQIVIGEVEGLDFYENLRSWNDSHYVGGGVKLGTPDRPILWYRPDGSKKYHVIYADLTVKEVSPEAAKALSKSPPATQ